MSLSHPRPDTIAPLSLALRERTSALHVRAERAGIIRKLLRGEASRAAYTLLLHNLLPAYRAMEGGLERHRQAPGIRHVALPETYRAGPLAADLAALGGAPRLLPEGEHYAARLEAAAAGDGSGLIGHAYARYLGDLSGGQIIKRLVARTLHLSPEMLSFYEFPAIGDLDAFKRRYRAGLDRAGEELADAETALAAAEEAFALNIALSEAVERAMDA